MRDINMDKTLDAIWVVDSESGQEVLIDRKDNQILARRDRTYERKPTQ